ncbi:ResIII domain-containing protein [Ruminococcaceae bacterium BL-4]|nr:ResIII domain-containing protein [Ruminococcaceae bacterium BL-4]
MNESKEFESADETLPVNLRPHQEQAINTAYRLLVDGQTKVLLQLATGSGKTAVLVELANRLLKSNIIHSALILTSTRMMAEQIASDFFKSTTHFVVGKVSRSENNSITILTYSKLRTQATITSDIKYDLIICDDAQYTKNNIIEHLLQSLSTKFVGIISPNLSSKENQGWFKNTPPAFTYSTIDSRIDGYRNIILRPQEYGLAVEDFLGRLLQQYGYNVIKEARIRANTKVIYPDLLVQSNEQKIVFEIKAYRNRFVSKGTIDTAVNQILNYKNILETNENIETSRESIFCLVLLCEIDHRQKEQFFKQYGITIWDIANLLFVCKENNDFTKVLNDLLYFPITDVVPEKPYGWIPKQLKLVSESTEPSQNIAESLEERLRACKPGKEKKASEEYECICTDIIRFLFENEFTQSSDQHKTGDDLFRMDLLCGIKGTSAFWELLIRHYNTRFVVFEYKNYSTLLPQNLIYVTEKYLFNAALRNVAIIISRKGFSKNAQIAALGCLKESSKLIIDLTDEDLIQMLHKKIDGEEASDFLLWKLECLLMSVGK